MRGFCNDRLFFRAGKSQFVESRGDMKNGNDIFVSLLVYFLLTLGVFELVPLIQREKNDTRCNQFFTSNFLQVRTGFRRSQLIVWKQNSQSNFHRHLQRTKCRASGFFFVTVCTKFIKNV